MSKRERLLIMSVVALSFTYPPLSTADTDLPPVGRSRFDQFVGDAPVPYPFATLLRQLDAQLAPDPGGLPPLKITLIPLGRSLQRSAAAPDFFHFPRVIVAVDSPTKPGVAPLQDRLFIGYQEKSAILEVISYNEAAGRFEFQVVRDYRQGAKPRLYYARRALCLACHQNAAPIFARPLWDETPANPALAAKLAATGRDYYGVKLRGTDIAYFIDTATDRANLFAVWQQIWREGCGTEEAGTHCRLEWFDSSLRYAMSGVMPPPDATRFEYLRTRWAHVWPSGLPIPNPDIPNRDPLVAMNLPGIGVAETSPDQVPAALEPLNPRPPLAYWKSADQQRLIAGLASLFNPADIVAVDQDLSRANPVPVEITLPCRLTAKPDRRISFACRAGRNILNGTWRSQTGAAVSGEITALQIGEAVGATDIRLHGRGPLSPRQMDFSVTRAGLSARLSDGQRLASVRFNPEQRRVTLGLQQDFAAGRNTALNALAGRAVAFDSTLWFTQLHQALAPAAPALRPLPSRFPPMQTEPATPPPSTQNTSLFDRPCGQCHHTLDTFPPNFLAGDAARRERQLDHCAERIYYRLRMWQTPALQRGKTPMPPPGILASRGLNEQAWRQSAELAALTEDAAKRIRRQHASPDTVLTQAYESLRSCLPPASH